jgi:hypothetical protein
VDSIYLAVNGQQLGPYTLDQIRQSIAKNEISRETLAWHEGAAGWAPLGPILDSATAPAGTPSIPPSAAPVPASIVAEFSFTKDELRKIARDQNLLMWSVFAGIVSYILVHALAIIGLFVALGALVFEITYLYKLGRDLRMTAPWAYCILLFIPFVGLITLVVISGKASRVLKAYGVPVGFMGGKASEIKD